MCFIYQTHPVAHAGMKMDYVDNTLVTNILKSCPVDIKLKQSAKKINLHLNVALMSGAYRLLQSTKDRYSTTKKDSKRASNC